MGQPSFVARSWGRSSRRSTSTSGGTSQGSVSSCVSKLPARSTSWAVVPLLQVLWLPPSAQVKIGCKLAFKALVKFIRHRYLSGAKMDVFVADYVCDSVGLKSEELVAIEDHSDEQWGFIKKRIKKRIKNFVKKSKKHFSRSKIHQYYKKYLSKYSKSRKKLKSWLKKRKMKGLVAIEDESDDESDVGFGKSFWENHKYNMQVQENHMKHCEAKQKESEECRLCWDASRVITSAGMPTNCHTGHSPRFNSNCVQIRPCPHTCTCPGGRC